MHSTNGIRVMVVVLAAWTAFDLWRTLRTRRARTWMNGTATREHQPQRYWRYVYQAWAAVILSVAAFLAVTIWPDFFR